MSSFSVDDKDRWLWTMMIRLPDEADPVLVDEAIETTIAHRHPPAGDLIRQEILVEGRAAQVMHRGPYADEGADELRAYELAVEHINAGGGGMLDTFSSKVLTGGINGKKIQYIMEDGGWLLIRFSGTEPLVRVYAEASSEELRDALLAAGDKMVNG